MLLRKGAWFYAASVVMLVGLVVFWTIVDSPAAAEEPQDHQHQKRLREVVELRDATSKTYELADGQREWVGYAEAVHYQDTGGTWRDIDNSIVSDSQLVDDTDYSLRNGANEYSVRFARRAAGANLVNISYRGASLAFGPADGKSAAVAKRPYLQSQALSDTTYGENCAVYEEVYPGVDLVYEAKAYGVKENIVLKDATVQSEFFFDLKLRGLSPKEADGRVVFVDDEDTGVFHLGPLLALDEAGASCEEVTCVLAEKGKKHQLKVAISRAYLEDPARVFPVIIDPSVMITGSGVTYDSFVSSRYPYNNYYLYRWLRTGRDTSYYTRRTFIRFNLSSLSGVDPDNVTAAYIRIKKYSGVTPSIRAYRVLGSWASSTITWNNKPGFSGSECSTVAYNDSGSWWRMYNLTVVKKWLAGTYGHYGWMIKDSREYSTSLWTTFYSSDAPSPNKPELHVVYTVPPPPDPYDPGCTGVDTDPWTYKGDVCSGGCTYKVDPINIVFFGNPSSNYYGTPENVVAEVVAHRHWTENGGQVGGGVQHVHMDASGHGGSTVTPVAMYPVQQGSSWLPTDTKEHLRYFGSPFKCTDEYGWFTLSDAHYEWFCLEHVNHHVFTVTDEGLSGFEQSEAWTCQAFASHGHSNYEQRLGNEAWIWNGHSGYAYNDGYAHYIDLTE